MVTVAGWITSEPRAGEFSFPAIAIGQMLAPAWRASRNAEP